MLNNILCYILVTKTLIMKTLLLFLSIMLCSFANAADYYFSQSTGNDITNLGTEASPWQTLNKAQTVFTTGNNLYFKRGDIWYGNLVAQGSGTSDTLIFVGAYGTGAKPIITGFTNISAWDSPVNNVYTSASAASTLSTCNIASLNGGNYAKARLPKSGYYTIGTTNGSTTITNSNISSKCQYRGASSYQGINV